MDSFKDIIGLFPSREGLARDMGLPVHYVHNWWNRDSIPARFWVGLIAEAQDKGFTDVDADRLAEIAGRGR